MITSVRLERTFFNEHARVILQTRGLRASIFRYPTGVEAIQIANDRGHLVVLPFMGQIIWDAIFDGVDLTMKNMFKAPRPARSIAETYGCFAFHSGLLRNGVPAPEDDHEAHGEFATAAMDEAGLETGHDGEGPYLAVTGLYEYVMGFGAHYAARPRVTLRPDSTLFTIELEVTNLSAQPMDLMYMAHVNFAYAPGGRIIQPAPFTPERTRVRLAVPAHVRPNPAYLAFIDELAADPSRSAVLDEPERYDPEQCFYLEGLGRDTLGLTHVMLRRREGDGFSIAYDPDQFPKTVRWILANSDQSVCAIALPSTCEPEGYAAEQRKGNVRSLAGNATAGFKVRLGYLDAAMAERAQAHIQAL
ncbi:protein of unknown function [Arboricoccus pini]|uniref:Monosaccharide-transporting ATPase n=1 Tax=Arboricoccus pini TaxID=1963835 RepID=A0A212RWT1_9PROT|nr:aldose 1-epimerase family protein [Arboricoccus pini]SNB77217.1 protein of unknown function [Arboricoccus pini]